MKSYKQIVNDYVNAIITGDKIACKEVRQACERYKNDLARDDLELRTFDPDFCINVIAQTFQHKQGEALDGTPMRGKPIELSPWQMFIVYNLVGFYWRGTNERRYKEALIMCARKNSKTTFIASLSWALSLLERRSGSTLYIVGASMKQSQQSFDVLAYNLDRLLKGDPKYRKRDNNAEHSIKYDFGTGNGSIYIEALASNPDAQDSFNCNIAICDEVHAFKSPAQYNRFKEAGRAYTNRLIIAITTAGDNLGFCYNRMKYGQKVLNGTVKDDSTFLFIAKADEDENGNVDYTNPVEMEKANPNWGVSIRPSDIISDALQAQNDPQQRKDFLSRSLDIFVQSQKAYFDLKEFENSDRRYNWTLQELAKLGLKWYGGADLSKLHDLTATALMTNYNGVDIIITHAFCPVVMAHEKADKDGIPLFGWRDDGLLTMCNTPTVNVNDVVKWFIDMRNLGFNIKQVGHDRRFSREYFGLMKQAKFNIIDQPQYYYVKSEGFRHIEKSAKDGTLYYLHNEAYEYCVSNVHAIETPADDLVKFQKSNPNSRIDLFDASVFAVVRYLENMTKQQSATGWF